MNLWNIYEIFMKYYAKKKKKKKITIISSTQTDKWTLHTVFNPLSTRPHQNVGLVYIYIYNNSWLGFLKILNYVPKERDKYHTAKNEPSFVTVKSCDGS